MTARRVALVWMLTLLTTTEVWATKPELTQIQVIPNSQTIQMGQTLQFSAQGTYSNGRIADVTKQVTWSSTGTDIATIDQRGLATGISAGGIGIIASLSEVSDQAVLTVVGQRAVNLSWTAGDGEVTANVYKRDANSQQYFQIATGVSGTTYRDTNVQSGMDVFYEVTAVNAVGESAPSNEVEAVIP